MRKLLALLSLFFVVVSPAFGGVIAVYPGDVDGNAAVTINDVVLLLRYSAGAGSLKPSQLKAADVNSDGQVGIGDVVLALRLAVGLSHYERELVREKTIVFKPRDVNGDGEIYSSDGDVYVGGSLEKVVQLPDYRWMVRNVILSPEGECLEYLDLPGGKGGTAILTMDGKLFVQGYGKMHILNMETGEVTTSPFPVDAGDLLPVPAGEDLPGSLEGESQYFLALNDLYVVMFRYDVAARMFSVLWKYRPEAEMPSAIGDGVFGLVGHALYEERKVVLRGVQFAGGDSPKYCELLGLSFSSEGVVGENFHHTLRLPDRLSAGFSDLVVVDGLALFPIMRLGGKNLEGGTGVFDFKSNAFQPFLWDGGPGEFQETGPVTVFDDGTVWQGFKGSLGTGVSSLSFRLRVAG